MSTAKGTKPPKAGAGRRRAPSRASEAVKAAADRAEARAKGVKPKKPRKPIDPKIEKIAPVVAEEHYKPKPDGEKPRHPGGRPATFKTEYIDQAKRLCALGLIDDELAAFFGIRTRTLYKWKGRYPEFGQAIKAAGAPADDRVELSLYRRAVGYQQDAVKIFLPRGATEPVIVPYKEQVSPDTTACIFWLKNRRPELWRDVNRHEHTGKDGESLDTGDDTGMDRARRLALILAKASMGDAKH